MKNKSVKEINRLATNIHFFHLLYLTELQNVDPSKYVPEC